MYWLAGMNLFDSIAHSLSTVSIGGFSTYDESIGYFNSVGIEMVCILFMIVSASSFALHYSAIFNGRVLRYFYDPEFRFFFSILLLVLAASLFINSFTDYENSPNFKEIIFHSVSMITTTGFSISDTSDWPLSVSFLLLVGAFVGACSGSVGGGVKSWRVMIMLNHAYSNIMKMIHPNSVISLKIGSRSVDDEVATSVWGFFSIYVISFMILLLAVLTSGLDLESAFSAVGACLNNLGPGLGAVSENYSNISSFTKSILAFAMLLGRLEIFTLLVILTPMFWAK